MTFDREPDLDNANVGMLDTRILGRTKFIKEVTKSVASFFSMTGISMLCGESPLGGSYRPTRKRLPRFVS